MWGNTAEERVAQSRGVFQWMYGLAAVLHVAVLEGLVQQPAPVPPLLVAWLAFPCLCYAAMFGLVALRREHWSAVEGAAFLGSCVVVWAAWPYVIA